MRDKIFQTLVLTMGPRALSAWQLYKDHPELPIDVKRTGDIFAFTLAQWINEVKANARS